MLRASVVSLVLIALIGQALAFELVVVNEANFSIIHKLYIAPAKSKKWSEDKLQNQTVAKNGRFTISDLPGGAYDLKIIDDDDDTCIITNINIDQNKEWKLTDKIILTCEHE
jgi:hypothetical protein